MFDFNHKLYQLVKRRQETGDRRQETGDRSEENIINKSNALITDN